MRKSCETCWHMIVPLLAKSVALHFEKRISPRHLAARMAKMDFQYIGFTFLWDLLFKHIFWRLNDISCRWKFKKRMGLFWVLTLCRLLLSGNSLMRADLMWWMMHFPPSVPPMFLNSNSLHFFIYMFFWDKMFWKQNQVVVYRIRFFLWLYILCIGTRFGDYEHFYSWTALWFEWAWSPN